MGELIKKLVLGTANFARIYNGHKVQDTEAIFDYCKQVGINFVDTAVAYGSEDLIPNGFEVISKLPVIQKHTIPRLQRIFFASLNRMNLSTIYAYLLHRPGDFNSLAWKVLRDLKYKRLVKKIGISVYDIKEVQNVDVIQCPYRPFKPYLPTLKAMGIEIHARKVFADDCYKEALLDPNADKVVIGVDNLQQLKEDVQILSEIEAQRNA